MSLYNNEFRCRKFSTENCYFPRIPLYFPSGNSMNTKKKKKLIQRNNNLSTKIYAGNHQQGSFSLNADQSPKKPKGYKDDIVRVNHSDRRLVFTDKSASFSKKAEALDRRTVISCLSASRVR